MKPPLPYSAEVRLLRWGDSSTAGRTITLEIPPDAGEVHPFKGFPVGAKYGQRFRMRFDVILDDETTPTAADSMEAPARSKDAQRSERAREQYAGMDAMEQARTRASLLCKDQAFQRWICFQNSSPTATFEVSEQAAACAIRKLLYIESRSEIATSEKAYNAFLAMELSYKQAVGLMAEAR